MRPGTIRIPHGGRWPAGAVRLVDPQHETVSTFGLFQAAESQEQTLLTDETTPLNRASGFPDDQRAVQRECLVGDSCFGPISGVGQE